MDITKEPPSIESDFIARQKQLNDQLGDIEKSLNKHNNHRESRVPRLDELSRVSQNRNRIKGFRKRESIFKRPDKPAPRSTVQTVPDYHRHPTKWKYYNLEHVSDMTSESNSQAAFAFLDDIRKRKCEEENRKSSKKLNTCQGSTSMALACSSCEAQMEVDDVSEPKSSSSTVVAFKKPRKKNCPSEEAKPQFVSSKVVMPEYEFGTKKVSRRKREERASEDRTCKTSGIKLDHLSTYDDGEG
ncbi:hypothetical protein QAD02_003989 [Eretmocerus hayati]|uniref:Uncharacterized protein n=1 Tax=Eretmocerus hayati TaxID=131215 RepID=A0ACC2NN98_9HYME|nr:hypothetical protein QAD02_003989 [Eretmocerus hayati]